MILYRCPHFQFVQRSEGDFRVQGLEWVSDIRAAGQCPVTVSNVWRRHYSYIPVYISGVCRTAPRLNSSLTRG